MPLTNYTTLKVSIQDWSHREDVQSLVDDFIDLAEEHMWKKLKLRDMETRSQATADTTSRFIALPDNFICHRKMVLISGNKHYELIYRTPESMQVVSTAGLPRFYTVTSQIEFDRIPDAAYTIENQHYAKLTALSSSNLTNAVITDYPSIYLYGALHYLWAWATDAEKSLTYLQLFERAMTDANSEDKRGRYGSAPVAIREGVLP